MAASLDRVDLTPEWAAISGEMVSGSTYRIQNNVGGRIEVAEAATTPTTGTSRISLTLGQFIDWEFDGTTVYGRGRAENLAVDIVEVL